PEGVAQLDGEAYVARQRRQEFSECAKVLARGLELRRQLHEHGGQLLAQASRAAAERSEDFRRARAAQGALVRDLARQLEREGEAVGRPALPRVEGRVRGDGVEGRVHLDGVEGE